MPNIIASWIVVILIFSCVFGNSANLYSFYKFPNLHQNPSYWHLAALSSADLGIGVVMAISLVNYYWSPATPDYMCDIQFSLSIIFTVPIFFTYPIITYDRYLKLTNLQKYNRLMKIPYVIVIHLLIWLIPSPVQLLLILSFPHHYMENDCLALVPTIITTTCMCIMFCIFYIPPLLLFVIFNYKTYIITKEYQEWLEEYLHLSFSGKEETVQRLDEKEKFRSFMKNDIKFLSSIPANRRKQIRSILAKVKHQRMLTKLILITTICRCCTTLISTVSYILAWACGPSSCEPFKTFPGLKFIAPWFWYVNSCINPYLLLYISKDFRIAFRNSSSSSRPPIVW